ncbi:methyltransferase domain-containing protein [Sodalis sp. RH14]|uniref:methyltransferase domain-containing protein n=1 Tax=Sodalis sp. RH14 TaxID=3394329 RepID=UPI0039B6B72D
MKSYYAETGKRNIFQLWESKLSDGDSTTPSVSSQSYREQMVSMISAYIPLGNTNRILSIGCGNAFVEAELVKKGLSVDAFDLHEEAVSYALEKGVHARQVDLNTWEPEKEVYQLVYCDGIMGHLYRKDGLQSILNRLHVTLSVNGKIIISNDPSTNNNNVQEHPSVPGFKWFSEEYIQSQLLEAGFKNMKFIYIEYLRPLSGPRNRLIVAATK